MARDDPQFNLRMTHDLKNKISSRAKNNGRSLNAEIVQILQDAVDEDERNKEDEILKAKVMENRKNLPDSYQEVLASFEERVSMLTEEATKKVMMQAGMELSLKIEELSKKKPT